jgi:GlpG protein
MRKFFGALLAAVSYEAPVSLAFLTLCLTEQVFAFFDFPTQQSLATLPARYLALSEAHRLVSYSFVHSNWSHFVGNLSLLLLLLPPLERKYGSHVVAIFLSCCAAMCGLLFSLLSSNMSLVGSSGVVFACIMWSGGATLQCNSSNQPLVIPATYIALVILWVVQELGSAWNGHGSVSHFCHFVGGLCGLGMALYSAGRQYRCRPM